MNANETKIQKLQRLIARDGRADAYVTFTDENGEETTANVKVFEVTEDGLDTKEYSGMEIFIAFDDIAEITF